MKQELFAISELSKLTGVNTVTLRAWERRYGLLKPKRTDKGHRLYDANDVVIVQTVLAWINKGVSVGKVKPLLHQQTSLEKVDVDEKWLEYQDQLTSASQQFNENKIDALHNKITKQYPLSVYVEYCLKPLFEAFEKHPKAPAELEFLYAVLKQRMSLTLVAKNRNINKQKPVLLFLHSSTASWKLWLTALWLVENNLFTLVFENIASIQSINNVVKSMKVCSALIYSGEKVKNINSDDLKEIESLEAIKISGPDIWLNKNKRPLKSIESRIIYNPIEEAKNIVNLCKAD